MMKKATLLGTLAGFGFLLGVLPGAIASEIPGYPIQRASETTGQFQRIEQSLGNKVAVTLGGVGLMGLELWWFLFSKPKSQKATSADDI